MAIIIFCTETLSLEDSLHSVIQFHGFYLKKWSFMDLSLFLVASFVLDKSLHESIRNTVPQIKKFGLEWAKTQLCHTVCDSWSNNQLRACRRRIIINFPQLPSTVESLVHAHQLNPNNPLAQPHRVSSTSPKLSEYPWQQEPEPVCYTCLFKHKKVHVVDPSVCSLSSLLFPSPIPLQYPGRILVSSCL